ncbi:MAG: hypothetical protein KGD63_02470 [Candidatus Lokiarchaeota archaeon]|nr:hypothetical protein [Candidatus Lokiarchaeota archaeon]
MIKILDKFQDWESIKVVSNSESILIRISAKDYSKFILITQNGTMFNKITPNT